MTPHRIASKTKAMRITPPKQTFHRLHAAAAPNTRRIKTPADSLKNPTSSPHPPRQRADIPSLPPFSLVDQLRDAKPAVRYTVYAGLGLMVTVETSFWFRVLRAEFFPSASKEERDRTDALLDRCSDAMRGYHRVWMTNYGRYYAAYIWGLGYGGLDGLLVHNGDDGKG